MSETFDKVQSIRENFNTISASTVTARKNMVFLLETIEELQLAVASRNQENRLLRENEVKNKDQASLMQMKIMHLTNQINSKNQTMDELSAKIFLLKKRIDELEEKA